MSGSNTDAKLDELISGRRLTDAGVWAYLDPVTPANSDLSNAPARGLLVVTAGDVEMQVLQSDGTTRSNFTLAGLAVGDVIPLAVYQVRTGTTATVRAGY